MKKVLLSLFVIVLTLGLLGAAGYAGYRYGFTQGMIVASSGATDQPHPLGPRFGTSPRGMPMHEFGFQRGFDRDEFGMMGRGRFGFRFSPLGIPIIFIRPWSPRVLLLTTIYTSGI